MNNELKSAMILCIIDKSGSMEAIKSDAIGGFNAFIERHKQMNGQTWATLVLFDHGYEKPFEWVDVHDILRLTESTYQPGGTTALLDAIGRSIDDLGKKLDGMEEKDKPEMIIVAILTDGHENASSDYTKTRVSEMIKHQQDKYSWEFVFLAANQDAFAEAGDLSIPRENVLAFKATGKGIRKVYDDIFDTPTFLRRKKTD